MSSGRASPSWWAVSASSRPAGPQANVVRSSRSGTSAARSATSSTPCTSSCRATSRIRPGLVEGAEVGQEDRVRLARGDVHHGDVVAGARGSRATPESVTGNRLRSMPDHRGHAGAGGDEQQPGRRRWGARTRRSPARGGPACRRCRALDQVVAHLAARHRLDGDRDVAVGARGRGSASRRATGGRRRRRRRSGRTGRARGRPSPCRGGSPGWPRRRSPARPPRSGRAGRRRPAAGRTGRGSRRAAAGW